MDQLTIPYEEVGNLAVRSASWGATVCHRIVMADGRVVYLHYEVTSYQPDHVPFTLHRVTVHDQHGTKREDYDLAPIEEGREADPMPRWLHLVIQNTPEPRPLTKD